MTRPIIAKAAALAWGAAICGLSASAAKAIEIDPYPGDGKCYFIENNQTIDYNNGAYSKSLLEENPWYGHQSTSEIAATQFWEKTGQTWRFAWKATSGNTNNGQTDALNTWYYARDEVRTGFYSNDDKFSTFAKGLWQKLKIYRRWSKTPFGLHLLRSTRYLAHLSVRCWCFRWLLSRQISMFALFSPKIE